MPRRHITRRLRRNRLYRNISAGIRDTVVLFREFRAALLAFTITLGFSGLLYHNLSIQAGLDPHSYAESFFVILAMIFFQANVDFPDQWFLQLFFFVMPLLGLGILGLGIADFGALLFNRKARGEAWQMAVASMYSGHIVLVGMGHVGTRVARELHNFGEDVVVIERDAHNDQLDAAEGMGFPIIIENALRPETLQKAGIGKASAALLCTNSDTMNLQIALKIRDINPDIRIVVRVFDDDFAQAIQSHFAIDSAFSASALAAPAFAAAAIEADIIPPVTLAGHVLSLGRFTIKPKSKLRTMPIGKLEHDFDVSVVLLERNGDIDLHPADEVELMTGDQVAIFAERPILNKIAQANRSRR